MRYAEFRLAGSGVVEAGRRTVTGRRLKHSAIFWRLGVAISIIALLCF